MAKHLQLEKNTKRLNIKILFSFLAIAFLFCVLFNFGNISAYFKDIVEKINNASVEPQYTITFDSNTGTGSMPTQEISYNVETKLNANTFTKTGYTFKGWSSLPEEYQEVEYIESSGTQYIDTGVIGKSRLESIADIMYVTVPFDAALLGSRQDNTRTYLIYSYPSRWCMGYGHYTSSQTQIIENERYRVYSKLYPGEQIIEVNDEKVFLELKTDEIDTNLNLYLFSLNYNGKPVGYTSARVYSLKILENGITVRNFIPCYRKDDGEIGLYDTIEDKFYTNQGTGTFLKGENSASYADEEKVINIGDATFYAQWEENIYTIEYELNGGIVEVENPTTYTVNTEDFKLNNPTKEGYTFKEWQGTNISSSNVKNVTIAKGSIGNRNYSAEYYPNSYSIQFRPNGGSGALYGQHLTYDVPAMLEENVFTNTGYKFVGWNTEADGSGTSYIDQEEVINLSSVANATVKLYAQWEALPIRYAVQIYGINQDVDEEGNVLGLTFGPATGASYNNSYVTHRYVKNDEGTYNIEIVTTTVDASGLDDTQTTEILVNSNNEAVTRTEEQVEQRQNINLHEMTWEEIAAIEDKTLFEDCMLCGDTKTVEITLNDTIRTTYIYNQFGDGAGCLFNVIENKYRYWNPNQANNSYVGSEESGVILTESEISGGSNAREAGGYSSSHIRATLIGENEKTNRGYAGDENLTEDNCIFSCIQNDLKELIASKKIRYITGTSYTEGYYEVNDNISDKIWLFSSREFCADNITAEGLGDNGEAYKKFIDVNSKYYISAYSYAETESRQIYNEIGNLWYVLLRTPNLQLPQYVRLIYSSGQQATNHAISNFGINFGFCIR